MPAHIDIANHYFHDAADHLDRFDLTWDQFATPNWRRVKACLDLRMACECILKSVIAYYSDPESDYDVVLRRLTKLGHNIDALHTEAVAHLATLKVEVGPCCDGLAPIPIDLRYRVESSLLKSIAEDFYYATIGSDVWVRDTRAAIGMTRDAVNRELQSQCKILHVSEITPNTRKLTTKQAWWLRSCIESAKKT